MNLSHDTNKVRLLVDGAIRGIYAWQRFVTDFDPAEWHIQPEDAHTLAAGPDDENYWEAATNAEMDAHSHDGAYGWHLVQYEGDIFAVRDDQTDVEYRAVFP